jgi:hypothetical protein
MNDTYDLSFVIFSQISLIIFLLVLTISSGAGIGALGGVIGQILSPIRAVFQAPSPVASNPVQRTTFNQQWSTPASQTPSVMNQVQWPRTVTNRLKHQEEKEQEIIIQRTSYPQD